MSAGRSDPLVCGDPIADRRYAYARSAAKDGDWAAAAEVLEQALERAPAWPPALFALGEAKEKLAEREGAVAAFRACLAADPADAQGAAARLALLGEGDSARDLPRAYVARLFDDYAPRFDRHLVEGLAYRGPALIAQAIEAAAPGASSPARSTLAAAPGLPARRCAGASTAWRASISRPPCSSRRASAASTTRS